MTTIDYIRYTETKREIMLTTKSVILSGIWKIAKTNWIRVSGLSAVLLAGQILSNAMLLHSTALMVVSSVFALIGLKLITWR